MTTGSTWTTTAAQNAATTTKAENKKATNDFLRTEAKLKIKHEPKVESKKPQSELRKVLNVSPEAVTAGSVQRVQTEKAQVALAEPAKQANQSGSMSVQDTEDGTVLRWR